jgi:hypothetical protein
MPRFRNVPSVLILAVVLALPLTSPGFASINQTGALMVPVTVVPKYCSGAFRYAARTGNSDIAPISPAQMYANERRFARTRYSAYAMTGFGPEPSRIVALNTLCGS